jgi:hypothetical protein
VQDAAGGKRESCIAYGAKTISRQEIQRCKNSVTGWTPGEIFTFSFTWRLACGLFGTRNFCSKNATRNSELGGNMGRESTQHKLDRVRSPRVHITYDVEVGNAIELKELPFVMGILGDLTGQPEKPLAALKDRKFVEINPDNFDTVLKGMQPHLAFSVDNKLSDDPNAGQVKVDLHFESMDGRPDPKNPTNSARSRRGLGLRKQQSHQGPRRCTHPRVAYMVSSKDLVHRRNGQIPWAGSGAAQHFHAVNGIDMKHDSGLLHFAVESA